MKYKNGDKVKVVSGDGVYSTYLRWICENATNIRTALPHWVYGREMDASDLDDKWTLLTWTINGLLFIQPPHTDYSKDIIAFIDNGKKIVHDKRGLPGLKR